MKISDRILMATAWWVLLLSGVGMLVMLVTVLAGCGGGDPEPEKTTQPVDCVANPKACQ